MRTLQTFRSRLTWNLVLVVFLCILAIETIILAFSYARQESVLLTRFEQAGAPVARLLARSATRHGPPAAAEEAATLFGAGSMLGAAILDERGAALGAAGEPIPVEGLIEDGAEVVRRHRESAARYDVAWRIPGDPSPTVVALRFDTAPVQRELGAFVLRISGLVLIISVFVTAGILLAVGPLLLNPLLALRNALVVGGAPVLAPDGATRRWLARRDELGNLFRAVDRLGRMVVSRDYFEDVLQSMSEMLMVLDADGRLVQVNRSTLSLLGYAESSLLGRRFESLLAEDEAAGWVARETRGDDSSGSLETRLARSDGSSLPVRLSFSRLRGGHTAGDLVCVARDITEQRDAEARRRESEHRFRDFAASAADWYWEMDEECRFSYFSDRFTEVTGVPASVLLGKTREETGIPDVDPDEWARHLDALANRRAFRGFVHPRKKPDGEIAWLAINGAPVFDDDGEFRGYRGTGSDITDRIRAQHALVRAKELSERAARTKSEFLANMSHELRTPLNAVIGMNELLVETDLTSEQLEYAATARGAGEVLLALINDILDLSKIEADGIALDDVAFDVVEETEDTVQALAESAHRKGLEIACDFDAGVPSTLRGDPGRLRQILTNLIGNAVKFTDEGEVVVRVSAAELADDAVEVAFEVRDTGVGIDDELRARLFEPFVQADASTTRRYGGTGLGLSISKQLAELMGGCIGVESEPGHGSTFRFAARLARADAASDVGAADGRPPELAGRRVLCVDDNETNRRILGRRLEGWGLRADLAASGAEALELLEHAAREGWTYSLALLDYQMPAMDGLELARRIRARAECARLPLAVLTSWSNRSELAESALLDASLSKPVRRRQLLRTVVSLLPGDGEARAAPARAAPAGDDDAKALGAHVLVVEDNRVNRMVAQRMLHRLACRVDVAVNGREALEATARERYDVVLMDCQMPEMDGYEATRAIRDREGAGERLPIVAMTANAMADDARRCLDAGMDGYVAKPMTLKVLGDELARWTGQPAPEPGADTHAEASAQAASA